ncbi:unnamed protein product [Sphagnum troendelagicum]|uniref:Alpha-ketoglutarate-dependent dioxygenase AlkB-like domain-containing protein n=1 Tax=Sphagnum troendelagicum TaxID=128251 RepID=A0ABP0UGF2_9BRYO
MAPKQRNHKRQQQREQEFYRLIGRRTGLNSTLFLLPGVFCGVLPSKERKVVLESGDILVFGGLSRLGYHGTRTVQHGT